MLQVVAETPEAMRRYIDFTSGVSKAPFLIDSTEVNTRIKGTQYVQEVGLADRAVYNSINVSVTEQELAAIKKTRLPCIVLAFNPKQQASLKGRLDVLISGGGVTQKGLLDMARECTDKILIDVAVTAFGIGAGPSEMSTYVMKTKLGLPIGCGVHNAVSSWVWLKNYKKQVPEGKDVFRICDVSSAVVHVMCGGDFVLYGPIENAPYVFPPVAMADCFIAEAVKSEVGTTPSKNHPLNKLIAE
jgi:tetrahydromethanopterin S-methyltransferase subunit H